MTEYVVYDQSDTEVDRFDNPTDAEAFIERKERRHVGLSLRVEEEGEDDENSAEDDTDNTSMSYDFITDDAEESEDTDDQQTVDDKWNWSLGSHSSTSDESQNALQEVIGDTMEEIDGDIDSEMMDVLEEAQDLVEDTNLTKFECSHEDCGLGHSHPDWKHDIRASHIVSEIRSQIPGFNITDSFAEQMEFVPYCHCGANEAAMLVQFFPYISEPMFNDQHEFEGVLEIEPEALDAIYRQYHEEDMSVTRAVAEVAAQRHEAESITAPLGVREDLTMFLERREQIEQQAQKAPIGQETRGVIEANREQLEAATSQ